MKTEEKRVVVIPKKLPNCCYGKPEHFANPYGSQACMHCGHAEEFVERIADNNEQIVETIHIGCKNLVKQRLIADDKLAVWKKKEKYYNTNMIPFVSKKPVNHIKEEYSIRR